MLATGEETREARMRALSLTALALGAIAATALTTVAVTHAAVLDEKPKIPVVVGEWTGKSETLVLDGPAQEKPQLVETPYSLSIEGQDGRRFWGKVRTADSADPFVALFSSSHVFGYGAGGTGFYHFRSHGPDRLELCYTQPGTSAAKAIAAACTLYTRTQP
jgi:hypothetical protein